MIGADPKADKNRDKPAVGDSRLLVTQVKGKTVADVVQGGGSRHDDAGAL